MNKGETRIPAFFRFPSKRRLLVYAVVFAALATYGFAFHTYRYYATEHLDYDHDGTANLDDLDIDGDGLANLSDTDADGDGVENHADVVAAARGMSGTVYDYSSGGYNNFFGRCGLLVCIDVPRLAYADAGIYLEQLLRDDFQKHPEHYDTRAGTNTPATPFFFRRVNNLLAYCEANGYCKVAHKPVPGDLLFYGSMHITMVTAVHPDGTFDEIESAPWTGMVVEHRRLRWVPREVGRIIPCLPPDYREAANSLGAVSGFATDTMVIITGHLPVGLDTDAVVGLVRDAKEIIETRVIRQGNPLETERRTRTLADYRLNRRDVGESDTWLAKAQQQRQTIIVVSNIGNSRLFARYCHADDSNAGYFAEEVIIDRNEGRWRACRLLGNILYNSPIATTE